jgi:FxsC-like protein
LSEYKDCKFFFSYARANSDEYLKKFFDDLSVSVRLRLGLDQEEVVGFFDQPQLELGADWIEKLNRALQECPVLVSLYSPAYFRSPYCGKEWEVFRRRRELYTTQERGAGRDTLHPAVIKPVIWVPLMEGQEAPEAVSGPQYFMGDPRDPHNLFGLRKMRKQYSKFEFGYDDFIEKLTEEIRAAQKIQLPRLPDFQSVIEIESAFHPPAPPPVVSLSTTPLASTTVPQRGPKFVRFVFIAGEPNQFPEGARTREFYLQFGGAEWKPYYPDAPRPIKALAQSTAADLDIFSDELRPSDNLAAEVRQAELDGSLVVLFVDSWTAELQPYRQILSSFDQQNYFNCSIFVPWNEKDPQTAGRQEQLRSILREEIFPRWSRLANIEQPIFFRDQIKSITDLRDQLADTLRQLQPLVGMGVIEKATKENIPRRIETEIARPVLSHKG